jgi:hypothetical protein
VIITNQIGGARADRPTDTDEALSTRLRDLALVDLDALLVGLDGPRAQELAAAYAEDLADVLKEARARMVALRRELGGPDPLNVLDLAPRQRASDAGHAGAERVKERMLAQTEAARAFARLAGLTAPLVAKLFEADRRR